MGILHKKVLGIDFHDYSAELVEIKQVGNKAFLESYSRALVPTNVIKNGDIKDPEALKEIIKKLLLNANPNPIETKNAAIIFPPNKVLTHIFTFPAALNEDELKKSIPFQAETVIPFSINDVYWDFMVLNKDSSKEKHASQEVFFAAIQKTTADQYLEVLEAIDLNPFLFGINAESLQYGIIRQTDPKETTLVIDVESLSVNYLILKNYKIQYFFSSNEGGKKLFSKIAQEYQVPEETIVEKKEHNKFKTIPHLNVIEDFIETNYKRAEDVIQDQLSKKVIQQVDKIVLTGEFLNLPNFYEVAKIKFPNQNVVIGDSKLNLFINQDKFTPMTAGEDAAIPYSTHFTNAVGIGLKAIHEGADTGINLLPDKLKESFSNKRHAILVAVAAIGMTAISLFTATFIFFKQQELTYKRIQLETEKSAIEYTLYGTRYQEIRDQIATFNKEIEELSAIDNSLFSLPNTLSQIEALIPAGIEVKSIDYNDEELAFSITGVAKTRDDILAMQSSFQNEEFIEEVIAPISNFDQKSETSFIIKAKLDFNKLAQYGSSTAAN